MSQSLGRRSVTWLLHLQQALSPHCVRPAASPRVAARTTPGMDRPQARRRLAPSLTTLPIGRRIPPARAPLFTTHLCSSRPGRYVFPMPAELRLEPCRSALNRVSGMPFRWSLNPYMGCAHRCTFCYVRAFERRAERPADDRYGRSIRVKTNVVAVLRTELVRPAWPREMVLVGAATDPYQPAEGRFRLTRGCLEAFAERSNPFSIITRGPMVGRDIDVLQSAAARARVSVSLSVPTLDEAIWRVTEPGTAPPRQRLRAVRALADAGVRVNVALAPILPGLSDRPELLAAAVKAARDAGAVRSE